jgi:dihydroxyacetone kinase
MLYMIVLLLTGVLTSDREDNGWDFGGPIFVGYPASLAFSDMHCSLTSCPRSIWLNALAAGFSISAKEQGIQRATDSVCAGAFSHALGVLYTYTAARRSSRTLIDTLEAFTAAFARSHGTDFAGAVEGAVEAAIATKDLVAKAGRAAYVGREALQEAQVPDPGAWGVAQLLEGAKCVA